jgi:ABC-type multidrug transport system ATPase subunit
LYDEENVVKKVYLIKTQDIKLSGDIINLPENIRLSNGYIVGICFKDTSHKERFISIFKGSNTKRLIRKLQSDKRYSEKAIDYVDQNIIESTLSVEEYLKFYGLLRNIYDVDFSQKMKKLLYIINLQDKKNIPMKELKRSQQKSVRVLASCLNNLLLFVGNNLLDDMDSTEKRRLYEILSICLKEIAICIVIEDTKDKLKGFADVIYEI